MSDSTPATAARCVPLCAAGDKAPWWQHEALCPARVRGTAPSVTENFDEDAEWWHDY
jgi:hypothetical protein